MTFQAVSRHRSKPTKAANHAAFLHLAIAGRIRKAHYLFVPLYVPSGVYMQKWLYKRYYRT